MRMSSAFWALVVAGSAYAVLYHWDDVKDAAVGTWDWNERRLDRKHAKRQRLAHRKAEIVEYYSDDDDDDNDNPRAARAFAAGGTNERLNAKGRKIMKEHGHMEMD